MESDINVTEDKKSFKKEVNYTVRSLFLYELVMFTTVVVCSVFSILIVMMSNRNISDRDYDALIASIGENGWSSILGIALGLIVILIYRKRELLKTDLTVVHKKMNKSTFVKILFVFMSVQTLFSLVGIFAELILNNFGYTMLGQIETATATSTTVSMFLYASFLGPITEEIVFRGAMLRSFQKFGKLFAIIMSSILFGVFHSNFIQGLFAAVVGLILGYVAMEYSFKWAVLIHIINNFVFSDVLGFLIKGLPEDDQNLITTFINAIFFIVGMIVLIMNRKKLITYLRENKSPKHQYKYTFTALWVILFIAVNIFLALDGIEKLI
jgi:membrane protease YdiL (CAAX protease family)